MSDSLLAEVIAVANVDDILRDAGLQVPENEKKPICCPLHSERSPSFFRQRSGKGYRCQGCGAHGGVLDLVVALRLAGDRKGAVDLLAARYGLARGLGGHCGRPTRCPKPVSLTVVVPPSLPVLTAKGSAQLRAAVRGCQPLLGSNGEGYVASRGVDPIFADACRVRFHPSWQGRGEAIVFPGYDQAGKLVTAQGRHIRPIGGRKCTSLPGIALGVFSTPQALANGLYGQGEPVAITEGPFDALAIAEHGLPSIATFGSSNRQEWLRKALADRNVILALDDDAAGRDAARWYRNNLNLGTDTSVTLLFDGKKDPGELWERSRSSEKLTLLVEEAIWQIRSWYGIAIPEAERVSDLLEVVSGFASSEPKAEDNLLLDYAGSVLGWHEDWPEHRLSNWNELLPFGELVESYPSLP